MAHDSNELEDLEALLASPGWGRLVAFANKEWSSEQYRARVQKVLGSIATNDQAKDAALLIMRLEDTAKAVDNLLEYPKFRIKQLQALEGRRR